MKQFITRRSFIKAAGAATALTAVSVGAPAAFAEETNCFFGDKADVTILYTNDVHTYIDNKSPKPTYAAIAALKKSIEDTGRDVLLVDAGDHIQGTAYGSMDDGATIIELMNEAGYDLATPGNHEFDYGMARAKAVLREADFPYVSCNWVDLRTGFNVLPSVKFFFVGGRKIAFVGVTTPETFTKSTPAYFMNDAQTKYIYDILGGEDGQKLYDAVQKAIDKAEFWGADTIIGLGHLGVDPSSSPWTSEEVIAHTHGFTAFIDGHSHTVMANKQVTDASGKAVTLTQTGSYFKNIGKMTVGADGTITTELIDTYEGLDAAVAATASNWRRGALPLPARARCAQLPALRHDGGPLPAYRLRKAGYDPGPAPRDLEGAGRHLPALDAPGRRDPLLWCRRVLAAPDAHLPEPVLLH